MIEQDLVWVLTIVILCFDIPLVWWMYKTRRKKRRFSLAPIFLAFAIPFFNQPEISESVHLKTVGIVLATLGFIIMTLGGYEFYRRGIIPALSKKESSYKPEEITHELVTTGIYRVFRHPQYVGLFAFFVGYFLLLSALFALCLTSLILGWFAAIAHFEEKYDLEVMFGDEYRKYKKKAGMFFPKINCCFGCKC